jgi:Secretion system C-terminal sorting domain
VVNIHIPAAKGVVLNQLCGTNSNSENCTTPCMECFPTEELMSEAGNKSNPWAEQSLYNQSISLYLQQNDDSNAIQLAQSQFQTNDMLMFGLLANAGAFGAAQAKIAAMDPSGVTQFYQVMMDMAQSGQALQDMSQAQEAALWSVATGSSEAKYQAQNVLSQAKGYLFERPVEVWVDELGQGENQVRNLNKPEVKSVDWLNISPNPGNGRLDIRWPAAPGAGIIEVFRLDGSRIAMEKITLKSGHTTLSLEGHTPGVYLLRLQGMEASMTKKVILE